MGKREYVNPIENFVERKLKFFAQVGGLKFIPCARERDICDGARHDDNFVLHFLIRSIFRA